MSRACPRTVPLLSLAAVAAEAFSRLARADLGRFARVLTIRTGGFRLGVVAVALVLAAPAQAHGTAAQIAGRALLRNFGKLTASGHRHAPAPTEPAPSALSQAAAVQYWGGEPCGGEPINVDYVPQADEPPTDSGGVFTGPAAMWTTWHSPTGTNLFTSPPSTFTDCTVWIDENWIAPGPPDIGIPEFCGLIVHEYGHLFGHPDLASDPPTSITYPLIGPANESVAPCVADYLGRAELGRTIPEGAKR